MPVTTRAARTNHSNNNTVIIGSMTAASAPSAVEEDTDISTTENTAVHCRTNLPSVTLQLSATTNTTNSNTTSRLIRIIIPPGNFTSEDLSKCIQQIMVTAYSNDDAVLLDSIGSISGLYRESDSTFIPLSYILSNADTFTQATFCLKLPTTGTPIQCPFSLSQIIIRYRKFLLCLLLFVAGLLLLGCYYVVYYRYQGSWVLSIDETIHHASQRTWALLGTCWSFVVNGVVDESLRAIYRYGPSAIGWEGSSLPKICSRATFYGTEEFWMKNYEECLSIYNSKELSFLAYTRPLVLLILLCLMLILLVVTVRRRPPPLDPNMVETFRSIQMLARQLKRAFAMAG